MMFDCIRKNVSCLPPRWIDFTLRNSLLLVLAVLVASMAILWYTVSHFKINTDMTEMISNELPFRRTLKEYRQAFPRMKEQLVVIVEGPTPEMTRYARKVLAARLQMEANVFHSIYQPGGGDFFAHNGLLYKNPEELEDLSDNLAEVQPFLGLLSEDLSLPSLFGVLEEFVQQSGAELYDNERILLLFDRLQTSLAQARANKSSPVAWQEIMLGQPVDEAQLREFIILQPVLADESFYPAQKAMKTLDRLMGEMKESSIFEGVKVRVTGSLALRAADLDSARDGIGLATSISFVLVALVLYLGLRSLRLVLASLFTLVTGLIWTMGFAIAVIGSLNLISVTFVVLFIGLGVDYSIQLCLRHRELLAAGLDRSAAIRRAMNEVGNALLLCSVTTAIGFYAFVPTAYTGASELGIISGTGMFLIFFANMSVLPALLRLMHVRPVQSRPRALGVPLSSLPYRHPRAVLRGAFLIGLGALVLLPWVHFDHNPLALSNPRAEAVATAKELLGLSRTSPWTISVLRPDLAEAEELAGRLTELEDVDFTLTIDDYVPRNQEEKLALVADTALFMPPFPQNPHLPPVQIDQTFGSLARFRNALLDSNPLESLPVTEKLAAEIARFMTLRDNRPQMLPALNLLNRDLLFTLAVTLEHLGALLQPERVDFSSLPAELKEQYIGQNGRYRVQVFPRQNLSEMQNLRQFVAAVREVAPDATDAPVTILESGRAISDSFRNAGLYALVVITLFLFLILRRTAEIILIMIPLLLAILYTAGATVLLDVPFNFANVIVLPLLLGIGIDYGIHLIYRFRSLPPADYNLLRTSTARAVLFSALTTIMSFSSLSFSSHQGTASMGILLTVCNLFMIFCTLTILPAILAFFHGRLRGQEGS